jgi:hypothetical protein
LGLKANTYAGVQRKIRVKTNPEDGGTFREAAEYWVQVGLPPNILFLTNLITCVT